MAKKRRTAASRTAARKAREAKKAEAKGGLFEGTILVPGRRFRACFHSNHELVIEWNHNYSRLRVRSLWGSIMVQPTAANEVEIS